MGEGLPLPQSNLFPYLENESQQHSSHGSCFRVEWNICLNLLALRLNCACWSICICANTHISLTWGESITKYEHKFEKGWGDGSAIKRNCCSCSGYPGSVLSTRMVVSNLTYLPSQGIRGSPLNSVGYGLACRTHIFMKAKHSHTLNKF